MEKPAMKSKEGELTREHIERASGYAQMIQFASQIALVNINGFSRNLENEERAMLVAALEAFAISLANGTVTVALRAHPPAASTQEGGEVVAWIEHHKGGDNLVWDQPSPPCTPLYKAAPSPTPDGELIEALREVPLAVHCPNCPDQGWYQVSGKRCGEPEQEQCEFCETTPNSLFKVKGKVSALLARVREG